MNMNANAAEVAAAGMPVDSKVFFEVCRQPGGELCHLPLQVKSLSGKGAILVGSWMPTGFVPESLNGQEGVLLILGEEKADDLEVPGKVLWTRPGNRDPSEYLVSLELDDPVQKARRALENQLKIYPRDIKTLWDSWDQVHQPPAAPHWDQGFYLVALAAVVGGLALYFTASGGVKVWGSIAAIYGSLMMAGKSLWSMWRRTVNSKQ